MRHLTFAFALFACPPAVAQVTPTPKLPPTNPVPYEDVDAAAVLAPVRAMLKALETNDGAAILANTRPEGGATVALEAADGRRAIRHLDWSAFVAGLKSDGSRYEERIFDPAVEVDGNIAMVWARYSVLKDGAVQHCGYDHFDLVRENDQWKVLSVTWSQRTTGCTAQ